MDERTTSMYLARILSGYHRFTHNGKKYKLKYPSIDIKYEAELVAQEEIKKNRFVEWVPLEKTTDILKYQGLWSEEEEKFLNSAEASAEKMKLNIYKNFKSPSLKKYKDILNQHNRLWAKLNNKKHSLDYVTLEFFCDNIKNQYILRRSIYDENGDLPFLNKDEDIETIITAVSSYAIPTDVFRSIARSATWSYYWSSKKIGDLFKGSIINWTDEQRVLASISRMYEGAREHPEAPDEDVFEDDDAFDGWTYFQREKTEEQKKKDKANNMLPGNLSKASDIFVMAHSQEDIDTINVLNNPMAKAIKKERSEAIKQNKEIKDQNLPDNKRDLIIKGTQERHKRGKL